jgi:hypothetical protein
LLRLWEYVVKMRLLLHYYLAWLWRGAWNYVLVIKIYCLGLKRKEDSTISSQTKIRLLTFSFMFWFFLQIPPIYIVKTSMILTTHLMQNESFLFITSHGMYVPPPHTQFVLFLLKIHHQQWPLKQIHHHSHQLFLLLF